MQGLSPGNNNKMCWAKPGDVNLIIIFTRISHKYPLDYDKNLRDTP